VIGSFTLGGRGAIDRLKEAKGINNGVCREEKKNFVCLWSRKRVHTWDAARKRDLFHGVGPVIDKERNRLKRYSKATLPNRNTKGEKKGGSVPFIN